MVFTVTDQLNRKLSFINNPKRIVSLVPSQTELLCDLGLEKYLVGVTKFCVHPRHLKGEKTIVGGTKQVHLDRIAALQPDIILCNKEENTKAMIADLEAIAPVHISDIYTLEDSLELMAMYGKLFDVEAEATALQHRLNTIKTEFEASIAKLPVQTVAYFIWKSPYMVAANNTFINHMLTLCKFKNSFAHLKRYPEIVLYTHNTCPDYVFLSSEPYPFNQEHINEFGVFFPNSKIVLVDGEMFSWYGSRLLKAFSYFKNLHENLRHS